MPRIAVLCPVPAHYNSGLFRRLAQVRSLDLTVLYCSAVGTGSDTPVAANFGRRIVWDGDLLSGYKSKFLWSPLLPHPQKRWTVLGPGLLTELHRKRYDAVIVFGWAWPVDWLAFVVASAQRMPFLLYSDTNIRDPGLRHSRALRAVVLGSLCRRAAGALYTGTFNRDFYIRKGMPPERLWFSPYTVERDFFAGGSRVAARRRLGLRDDTCYFLFAGALQPRKRPLSVLSAVAALQARGRAAGALFVGSGELEPELRRLTQERGVKDVELLGFVNQSALPDVYAAADAFVLPSIRDPRATVVIEAMAAGRPVVVSTGTGVWGPGDLVKHGREGFVVETGDEAALVAACDALTDPERRRRMGEAAAARARYWSYERAVMGWVEAVNTVLGRSPGLAP